MKSTKLRNLNSWLLILGLSLGISSPAMIGGNSNGNDQARKDFPQNEIKSKLLASGQLSQLQGAIETMLNGLQVIAGAASNENHNSQSQDVWRHIFRIRHLSGEMLATQLKSQIPGDVDQTIRVLLITAADGIIQEGSRTLRGGDANYWFEQIGRIQSKFNETSLTLKSTAQIVGQQAEALRGEAMSLMLKAFDDPNGIPSQLRSEIVEQMSELNSVDARYKAKHAQLNQSFQTQRAAMEAEFAVFKKALDAELLDLRAATLREQTTKTAQAEAAGKAKAEELEAKFAKQSAELTAHYEKAKAEADKAFAQNKTKFDTDIEELRKKAVTATEELRSVEKKTTDYLAQAAAAQKKLDESRAAIQDLLTQIRPADARGSVITKISSGDSNFNVAFQTVANRLVAAIRELTDTELWDKVRPVISIDMAVTLDKSIEGTAVIKAQIQIGRDQITLPTQMMTIRFKQGRTDNTSAASVRATASALAPEVLTLLQNARVDDWAATMERAVKSCEDALRGILSTVSEVPVSTSAPVEPQTTRRRGGKQII